MTHPDNKSPFIDDSLKTDPQTTAVTSSQSQTQHAITQAHPEKPHATTHDYPIHDSSNAQELELLEERASVERERIAVGHLTMRKEVRTQTVQIPVTLRQELLIIEHHPGAPLQHLSKADQSEQLVQLEQTEVLPHTMVNINGQPHDLDQESLTLVLSQEVAKINVHTVVAEKVKIGIEHKTFEKSVDVVLRHEELVTEQVDYETPKVLSSEKVPADFKPHSDT